MGALLRVGRAVLDAVLPARCMACGETVDGDGALCAQCWLGIRFLAEPACACCGFPFEFAVPGQTLCIACTRALPAFERARAVFAYDDASRGLILAFKHADRIHHSPVFGRWLARSGAALVADADLIVPVPLHRWRLFRRRYNQAGLLAQALGRETGKKTSVDLLVRHRRTRTQGRMSRAARIRNIQGAFRLRENRRGAVGGARILLIDDVLTTGATVEECSRVLKRAGARAVDVLTLARVVRPQV
jgi:ComF family protein